MANFFWDYLFVLLPIGIIALIGSWRIGFPPSSELINCFLLFLAPVLILDAMGAYKGRKEGDNG